LSAALQGRPETATGEPARAPAERLDGSSPGRATSARRLWTFLRHEPLVHFLVLGGLLFAANAVRQSADRETIVIDRPTLEALIQQQTEIAGHPPSDQERALLIQGVIDDAVLLREAYKRGLAQDAVIERHLVQKMRFLLSADVPEPSEAELRAYFAAEAERYRTPPTVTLDQVFYADPASAPDGLLKGLQSGMDFRGLGDRLFMLGPTLARYSAADLADLLGADLAQRIFELPPGSWQGPFRSAEGVHFIRVRAREPAGLPAFEEIVDWLRQDWQHARQQEAVRGELEALRARYRVVVEGER
jgi:hypothetical protein